MSREESGMPKLASENTPFIESNVQVNDETSLKLSNFKRGLGIFVLLSLMGAVSAFIGKNDRILPTSIETTNLSSNSTVVNGTINSTNKEGEMRDDVFHCYDYDDDTIFTSSLCSQFDAAVCFTATDACTSDYWCNTLCGDMCDEGGGAICFFKKISTIKETCKSVSEILADNNEIIPEDALETEKELLTKLPNPNELSGHGIDSSLFDDGCGRHAYCTYCTNDCGDVASYIHDTYDIVDIPTIHTAVSNIVKTCIDLGYISKGDVLLRLN
eukprot:CAMPEP_0114408400 /NCGR_PEP_ID=MMETSP0102-20121206/22667_1 /TAXON_ID=38822 ORGANISM="Pteridomonas danica, Strain PT" /NCGR_SAMPLE_ID=MMETSP0102 /ASSEMBLY_ACC=CAM_ASM_000212 /LENGTH=270 /DNA_ID=CAMNT_0001575355 /DNA_START=19 /DNA_END=831 /DNA_ORIENTATION=-